MARKGSESADAESNQQVTLSIAQLEAMIEKRVQRALKQQQGVRHAKSPAPRIQVMVGRSATPAGYWDSRTAKQLDAYRAAFHSKEMPKEERESQLATLVLHRSSIVSPVDRTSVLLDELIAELQTVLDNADE